jgi:hypothetical protein
LSSLGFHPGKAVTQPSRSRVHFRQIRLFVRFYDKTSIVSRLLWILHQYPTDLARSAYLLEAAVVPFTGSPPYLLHWVAPLNLLLRRNSSTDLPIFIMNASLHDVVQQESAFASFTS